MDLIPCKSQASDEGWEQGLKRKLCLRLNSVGQDTPPPPLLPHKERDMGRVEKTPPGTPYCAAEYKWGAKKEATSFKFEQLLLSFVQFGWSAVAAKKVLWITSTLPTLCVLLKFVSNLKMIHLYKTLLLSSRYLSSINFRIFQNTGSLYERVLVTLVWVGREAVWSHCVVKWLELNLIHYFKKWNSGILGSILPLPSLFLSFLNRVWLWCVHDVTYIFYSGCCKGILRSAQWCDRGVRGKSPR